jgi:hypothetical protein
MTLKKLHRPILAGIALLIVGIWISDFFDVYHTWSRFDDALHLIGGLVAAWFIALLFAHDIAKLPRFSATLFIIGLTLIIGVVWEMAEFLSGKYMQNIYPLVYQYFRGGDLQDTIADLSDDIIGALTLAWLWLRTRRT